MATKVHPKNKLSCQKDKSVEHLPNNYEASQIYVKSSKKVKLPKVGWNDFPRAQQKKKK